MAIKGPVWTTQRLTLNLDPRDHSSWHVLITVAVEGETVLTNAEVLIVEDVKLLGVKGIDSEEQKFR